MARFASPLVVVLAALLTASGTSPAVAAPGPVPPVDERPPSEVTPAATATETSATPFAEAAVRKCQHETSPFPDAPQLGLLLDGRLVATGDDGQELQGQMSALLEVGAVRFRGAPEGGPPPGAARLYEVRIVCARDLHERTGLRIGDAAWIVHTRDGPVPAIVEILKAVDERQRAFFREEGRYAEDPDVLGELFLGSELVEAGALHLEADQRGWRATLEHPAYPFLCGIHGGSAAPIVTGAVAASPVCPVAPARVD